MSWWVLDFPKPLQATMVGNYCKVGRFYVQTELLKAKQTAKRLCFFLTIFLVSGLWQVWFNCRIHSIDAVSLANGLHQNGSTPDDRYVRCVSAVGPKIDEYTRRHSRYTRGVSKLKTLQQATSKTTSRWCVVGSRRVRWGWRGMVTYGDWVVHTPLLCSWYSHNDVS